MTLYGVFTNHSCVGVPTHCLLLELLDVSVSELLVRGSTQAIISSTEGGSGRYACIVCELCLVVAVIQLLVSLNASQSVDEDNF